MSKETLRKNETTSTRENEIKIPFSQDTPENMIRRAKARQETLKKLEEAQVVNQVDLRQEFDF